MENFEEKRTLKREKEILERRERELKTIMSTYMQSIRRLQDMQRPHGSAADISAELPACGLKYAEPKKESDASSSSSDSDQNHLRNILMANRELIYSGADRLARERREIRNHNRHVRHYNPSLSQPRTCTTSIQPSTLHQVSYPVPHLITPLVSPTVMHQVSQPLLQSVPWSAAPHPLCVDQGTQTEVPYPKPMGDYIKKLKILFDEVTERQSTMIARFFETVIKGTTLEPMFKQFCNEADSGITDENNKCEYVKYSEYLVNGHVECKREYEKIEHYGENEDNEVNGHNEQNEEHEVNGDDETNDEDEDNSMDWIPGDSSELSESSHELDAYSSTNNSGDDMVPIGNGYVEIPRRLLRDMNWASYSTATRKLLHAIFPRKVLATHSLSGRPSPAFTDKPAKQRLNQDIVNDIVKTVTQYCKNVTNSMVRGVISSTCTDEKKLFRNRQFKKQRKIKRCSTS